MGPLVCLLRHQPVVESVHGKVDQRVCHPAVVGAVVSGARPTSQGLQRRAHGGATGRIQDAAQEDGAIFGVGAQPEAAVLDQVGLGRRITLGIGGMPGMAAEVVELAHGVLERCIEEPPLVEGRRGCRAEERVGRPGHDDEVTKADVAIGQRVDALRQLGDVLANRHQVSGCRTGHVAVDADPIDRGGGAVIQVVVGGGELGRFFGQGEAHQIDDVGLRNEARAPIFKNQLVAIDFADVLRREHKRMLQTNVRNVKGLARKIWRKSHHKLRANFPPPSPRPRPLPSLPPRCRTLGVPLSNPRPTKSSPADSPEPI